MKRIIFWIISAAIVIGGGYIAYHYWQTDNLPQFSTQLDEISGSVAGQSTDFGEVSQTATDQFEIFTERAVDVSNHARAILSTAIQPNVSEDAEQDSTKKPLHETAVEYGQYVYCKQVVESYETANQ